MIIPCWQGKIIPADHLSLWFRVSKALWSQRMKEPDGLHTEIQKRGCHEANRSSGHRAPPVCLSSSSDFMVKKAVCAEKSSDFQRLHHFTRNHDGGRVFIFMDVCDFFLFFNKWRINSRLSKITWFRSVRSQQKTATRIVTGSFSIFSDFEP